MPVVSRTFGVCHLQGRIEGGFPDLYPRRRLTHRQTRGDELSGARDPFNRMAPALEKALTDGGANLDARLIDAGHELAQADLTIGAEWLAAEAKA